jgi:hypothetical protein
VSVRRIPLVTIPILLFVTALLFTRASSGAPGEWPNLRPGSWEFTRTIRSAHTGGKPQVVKATRCTDPVADMRQQNARLSKAGCTFSPMVRRGNTYTFTSQCKIAGMEARSKSTLTVESPTAYRLHVDTVEDGTAGQEDLVARRVGDCRK